MPQPPDPLARWLALVWERPERSYNPDLRDFLAGLLDYPKAKVVTEDTGASGYPDIKLLSPEGSAWVVGDLKKDDAALTDPLRRAALWQDKRKYVDGLTRFVLFLTAHFVWVALPDGPPHPEFAEPLDLRSLPLDALKTRLAFLNYGASGHARQWQEFITGALPFSYLLLTESEANKRLQADLRAGFAELSEASTRALSALRAQFGEYERRQADMTRNLVGRRETERRARVRLEQEFEFVRRLFAESLPQFEEQYGREVEANKSDERARRVQEAFVADSVAALMARVLFLRLVEDLGLTKKRRLSNGGPRNWAVFVEELTGDAGALVRVASEDVARLYREPFAHTVFDWIHHANGTLDEALQRLILRLNAYNFAGLSEEILGDIYQQFLPPQKRKQLGEYYTPPSVVDWILSRTTGKHGPGAVLDPSCGSGSFLVRHAHERLTDAAERNLDRASVARDVQEEVWGFDLNPFAAFISLFQVTWALLRFGARGSAPHVHIYNLNSLLRDTDIAAYIGVEHLAPGSQARDEKRWRYVVGNPPYIRAERVKYGEEMRELWAHVWGQNADTGLVFLHRALTEWLEPGGFLGMVVSGGYANTEAAAKAWNLLLPGGTAALRQVVWMEFVEANGRPVSVWDAARVPLIVIVERVPAKADDEIELYTPSHWPSEEPPTRVRYSDFFDKHVSPNVTNPLSEWGDYLLPLLRAEDVPLLRRLYPNQETLTNLGAVVKWTYGIQRGGVDVTPEPTGARPVQVVAGRSVAVAWPGVPAGWVDLDAVEKRPYGKLSLWGRPSEATTATSIFVAEICSAPFAALGEELATVNTVVVGRGSSDRQNKAVTAYLNSSLARYYWALRLRSGVIQGYYAHIYPRTLEAFPWPANLPPAREQTLADGYAQLAALAVRAKDNPDEWLLAETERRLALSHRSLSDPALGLRFDAATVPALASQLQQDGARLTNGLFLFAEVADPALAEYLFRLLALTTDPETPVTPAAVQKLLVPPDYAALMRDYHARRQSFARVEQDFRQALSGVDDAVYDAFGLSVPERAAIHARLSAFPLNRLTPRFPWQAVRPRPIKAYTEDRFR